MDLFHPESLPFAEQATRAAEQAHRGAKQDAVQRHLEATRQHPTGQRRVDKVAPHPQEDGRQQDRGDGVVGAEPAARQTRQNIGVNNTSRVNTSSRPSSMVKHSRPLANSLILA